MRIPASPVDESTSCHDAARREKSYGAYIDVGRIEEALRLVEHDHLGDAATLLGSMVRGKRYTRPGRLNAESVEVDEVKGWLRKAIADPSSADSRFMVERAYYKLRTLTPA